MKSAANLWAGQSEGRRIKRPYAQKTRRRAPAAISIPQEVHPGEDTELILCHQAMGRLAPSPAPESTCRFFEAFPGTCSWPEARSPKMRDLISERIEVEFEKKPGPPSVIHWRGQAHKVASCVQKDYDYGFRSFRFDKYGLDWRLRRRRTYYLVTTDSGETLEIYHDRGRNEWFILTKTSPAPSDPSPG